MILYKYPKLKIYKNESNVKILLFIGEHSEQFINSFLNIYSGVRYEDNFRYEINSIIYKDKYEIYSIKGKVKLNIICFPKKMELREFTKNIINIFLVHKNVNPKINCIFITSEKKQELLQSQKIMILSLFNLLEKGNNENRIMFLYSMNDSVNNSLNDDNNKNNIITNNIIFNEYIDISYYNPKYYYININAIYDKNNENSKNNWIDLEKTVKSILEIIPSKGLDFDKKKNLYFTKLLLKKMITKTSNSKEN